MILNFLSFFRKPKLQIKSCTKTLFVSILFTESNISLRGQYDEPDNSRASSNA
jgi:hypothetical protein